MGIHVYNTHIWGGGGGRGEGQGRGEQKDTLVLCSSLSDSDPYGSNLLKYRRAKKHTDKTTIERQYCFPVLNVN